MNFSFPLWNLFSNQQIKQSIHGKYYLVKQVEIRIKTKILYKERLLHMIEELLSLKRKHKDRKDKYKTSLMLSSKT